jgi:hypothetical protein
MANDQKQLFVIATAVTAFEVRCYIKGVPDKYLQFYTRD